MAAACLATALVTGGATLAITSGRDSGTNESPSGGSVASGAGAPGAAAVDWSAVAEKVRSSVVTVSTYDANGDAIGTGSGTFIDNQGHILTNAHVATYKRQTVPHISIQLPNGKLYTRVHVTGVDTTSDLAVLTVEQPPTEITPVAFGDSSKLVVGQPVMAIGSPRHLTDTVTTGIISAVNRPTYFAGTATDAESLTNCVQTDAAVNPGNSGGALVDASGAMVGVPSSGATDGSGSGSIGLNFAIPSNLAKKVADQLIKSGKAVHAALGATVGDGTADTEDGLHRGAKVTEVQAGTPAQKMGLLAGDVIVKLNDTPITSGLSLLAMLLDHSPGDTVNLMVARGGKTQTVAVQLTD